MLTNVIYNIKNAKKIFVTDLDAVYQTKYAVIFEIYCAKFV